jgi:hypothetical protein
MQWVVGALNILKPAERSYEVARLEAQKHAKNPATVKVHTSGLGLRSRTKRVTDTVPEAKYRIVSPRLHFRCQPGRSGSNPHREKESVRQPAHVLTNDPVSACSNRAINHIMKATYRRWIEHDRPSRIAGAEWVTDLSGDVLIFH